MRGSHEFWLTIHALLSAYKSEGKTRRERTQAIMDQFRRMPAIARKEVLQELFEVSGELPMLYQQALDAADETSKVDPTPDSESALAELAGTTPVRSSSD
jgi:hypothetical protein